MEKHVGITSIRYRVFRYVGVTSIDREFFVTACTQC